jgi:tRNA uridine 5-carbamoylmethylation protein Kti12
VHAAVTDATDYRGAVGLILLRPFPFGEPVKVINLFGGPGCGKSTTAAALFVKMKNRGMKVELVTEFAKDLTYEKRGRALSNQLYVLGKQDQRLRRLEGHVDWAITDSPLILSLAYAQSPFDQDWYTNTVVGLFNTYDNFNVNLIRDKPYATFGRNQTEEEAEALDEVIVALLRRHVWPSAHPRAWTFLGDEDASANILHFVVDDAGG